MIFQNKYKFGPEHAILITPCLNSFALLTICDLCVQKQKHRQQQQQQQQQHQTNRSQSLNVKWVGKSYTNEQIYLLLVR